MSEIMRICAQCGQAGPLEARYCPHCGHDAETGIPTVMERRSLPAAVTRAALPVLAGLASVALRAGWQLLRNRMTTAMTAPVAKPVQPVQSTKSTPASTPRRVIRIRSSWAVGDGRGNWRQGASDHTIEINEE